LCVNGQLFGTAEPAKLILAATTAADSAGVRPRYDAPNARRTRRSPAPAAGGDGQT